MSVAEFNFDIAVSTLIAVIIAVYYKCRYGDEDGGEHIVFLC